MLQSGIDILTNLFSNVWLLFTSWPVPGTAVSPAGFFVFILIVMLFIKLVRIITGNNGG